MSEEIIKVLNNLGEKFGVAIDWTSQNIMPYIQELMNRYAKYYTTSCIIWLLAEFVLLIISVIVFMGCIKEKKQEEYWDWMDEGLGRIIFLIISGTILAISLPITIQLLLRAIYMPELIFIKSLGG